MKKLFTLYIFCLLAPVTFGQNQAYTGAAANPPTEILWDKYGVPHVYGRTIPEMYYAFGWAQMHNHANLLLELYGQARGRAAEYWGMDYLATDKQVHLFNLPETARQHYAQQNAEYKSNLDAFVKGINAYAQARPEAIEAKWKRVLPITPADVLAHSTRVICLQFLGAGDIYNAMQPMTPGSNAYAIAPSKSASKNAMLMANPHLPWSSFYLFFEAHLTAPGFQAYGASLVGQPVLNISFNNNLGWTHTVNTIDASDRYELTLKNNGYLLDGVVQPFTRRKVTLKVRQEDGSFLTQPTEFLNSKHGPIVGEKNGKAYAVRVAGLENAFLSAQYHKMALAQNFNEFETALKMLQNPMFNVIYADREGNILYLFNGNVPKRSEGDWAFWKRTLDGSSSKYLWTQYHAYDDLPKVLNPKTGFVQNANDPPWTSTYPVALQPEKFPAYMSPQEMRLRPQRAINLIKDDAAITFDELVTYKLNTGLEAADRLLDDLMAAIKQYPDPVAIRALPVLQKWDKTTNAQSKGAVLFVRWLNKLDRNPFQTPWDPAKPLTTPDGLLDPKKAVALFARAALEVETDYGALDVPWGDVYRFRMGEINVPGNGGPDQFGAFRVIQFAQTPTDGNKSFAMGGDSYVAITEFGPKVKAQVLLSYGNATQPGNKHVGDQLPLLSQKKLRPALLEKNEVLQNLEKREQLYMQTKQPGR
ncbi:MAG: acylase [Bacteroidota bacterium]|nr:acylase [Bacteroidota bacterium]